VPDGGLGGMGDGLQRFHKLLHTDCFISLRPDPPMSCPEPNCKTDCPLLSHNPFLVLVCAPIQTQVRGRESTMLFFSLPSPRKGLASRHAQERIPQCGYFFDSIPHYPRLVRRQGRMTE